jgi:hypothetical protein
MQPLPIRLMPGQDLRRAFTREPDAATGYDELVVRRKRPDGDA